jgi:hypothetical protein
MMAKLKGVTEPVSERAGDLHCVLTGTHTGHPCTQRGVAVCRRRGLTILA